MIWYVLLSIAGAVSLGMRVLPFLFGSILRRFSFLHKLSVTLPFCLLVMITAYTMHTVNFKEAPFGLMEILALVAVVMTQIFFRTITISMLVGIAAYQGLRMIFLTS